MQGKEDYLRVILELLEETDEVRSIDISRTLRISKPSVSEMLKKLAKENLVEFKPYSKIKITRKGRRIAEEISNKHKIIEKFAEKFQVTRAHEQAHKLEHHFSDNFLIKLQELTEGKAKIKENPPAYIS